MLTHSLTHSPGSEHHRRRRGSSGGGVAPEVRGEGSGAQRCVVYLQPLLLVGSDRQAAIETVVTIARAHTIVAAATTNANDISSAAGGGSGSSDTMHDRIEAIDPPHWNTTTVATHTNTTITITITAAFRDERQHDGARGIICVLGRRQQRGVNVLAHCNAAHLRQRQHVRSGGAQQRVWLQRAPHQVLEALRAVGGQRRRVALPQRVPEDALRGKAPPRRDAQHPLLWGTNRRAIIIIITITTTAITTTTAVAAAIVAVGLSEEAAGLEEREAEGEDVCRGQALSVIQQLLRHVSVKIIIMKMNAD